METETETEVETCRGTQDVNGDGSGDGNESSRRYMNWNKDGNGDGTRTGSGRAEERRMSAKNRTRLVDAISPFHSVRFINSADGGWCLRAPDSSVRKARRLYTHIKPSR